MTETQRAKAQARFETLQQASRDAAAKRRGFQIALDAKYGCGNACWCSTGERRELDRLTHQDTKRFDAFFAFLMTISGRSWDSLVPCSWLRDSLTFADAITSGQLSIVPPCSYGTTPDQIRAFCTPVTR